ncbi:MAG: ATP-dependent DNA ligase, partial [Rhizobacter sp.]
MKAFAQLFAELDATTSTRAKTEALVGYFKSAPAADAAWALYMLAGGKPRQTVPTALLRSTAREMAGIPEWLFDESYNIVGDLAETVALVLPPPGEAVEVPLHVWMQERLIALRGQTPEATAHALRTYWNELDTAGRFILTKLIGGGFRVGVARNLVVRALAQSAGLDAKVLAQRMMGYTDKQHTPSAAAFTSLLDPDHVATASGQPYPFFLAHPLQAPVESLGD